MNCPNTPGDEVSGTDSTANGNTDGSTDCGNTLAPVNDFSGTPVINEIDIPADGFGGTLSYTRTWSGLNNSGSNGNGWTPSTSPYLYVYSVFDPQTKAYDKPVIAYVDSDQNTHLFDFTSGTGSATATARFYGQEQLSYNATTTQWTVTDTNGSAFVFNDLPRDSTGTLSADATVGYHNQATYGKVTQSTDAGGVVTSYAYYTSGALAGQVKTIDRGDASTGEAEELQFTYDTWNNSLGGSATLIASVSLARRPNSSSSLQSVRTATYDYYTGDGADASNGRLGDLKLVTIHDGSATGAVLDHDYYRYYKLWSYNRQADPGSTNDPTTAGGTDSTFTRYTTSWSDPYVHFHQGADNSLSSGLKTVVDGAAYDRLAANVSSITAASDGQVQPYVDHFFMYSRWGDFRWEYENYANDNFSSGYHYYTRYHVTEEIAQGTGCSACSDGQGTYGYEYYINPSTTGLGNETYDPNVWRMRTIEYLPDTTNADSDGDGKVDPSQWADNDRDIIYTNEDGQVILKDEVDVDDTTHGFTSLSRSGRVVTVTSPTHGLSTGDYIAIDGATASATGLPNGVPAGSDLEMYNGMYQVTVVDANTFTYTIASTPDDTATPDVSKMAWSKVLKQSSTYYRYSEQSASGSQYVGYGQVVLQADPSAVTGYDESYTDLVTNGLDPSYNNQYLSDNSGLMTLYTYYSSTTATEMAAGGVAGYLWQTKIKHGEKDGGSTVTGGGIVIDRKQYFVHTANGITVDPVANEVTYSNADGTGAETTSYVYTYLSGSLRPQSMTTTLPAATSAQNGPNSGDVTTVFYDLYGNPTWTKDGDGYITYKQYDPGTGAVVKTIQDVDTTQTSQFSNLPSGWTTPSGGGLNLVTTIKVDGYGRPTQTIDPNGNVNYNVYNDAAHEIRSYIGWNATTGTTTEPIHVYREYRPTAGAPSDQRTVYDETLDSSATPSVSGTAGSYVPTGTETIDASNLQALARTLTNTAGQTIESDQYFSFAGLTYSQGVATLGSASNDSSTGNYSATTMAYDDRGRLRRQVDPTGTITRTIYDLRGMVTQTWVGTDDTPTSGYWSPTNTAGTNMVLVEARQYDDDQSNGDENLTQDTLYPGGSATPRVTTMYYDWRDRLVATKDATEPTESAADNTHFITYTDYDNLDRAVAQSTYDGDGVNVTDTDGDGVPDKPSASLLRAYTTTTYDGRDRVYRSTQYSVDPSNGAVSSNGLVTAYWHDHRNNIIKTQTPNAAFTKTIYDGAGRPVTQYITDAGGDSTWSDAKSVTGDTVLEQTETTYDGDRNPILVNDRLRFDSATGTGVLKVNTSTTTPSRSQYTAFYYDAANRLTNTVDVGSDGGAVYTRPASVPARSDTALVTTDAYNAAGRLASVTDPRGLVMQTWYDALGRTTMAIADYVDGTPSDSDDQATDYTYDGSNHVLTLKAVLPAGAFQTTQYVYGASQSRGDALDSNDVLVATRYPDPSTGAASTGQEEDYTTDAGGERTTYTDRNGSTHTYSYDVLGRSTSDTVTNLGTSVDGSIRRLDTAYDSQGNVAALTSYADTAGTVIANQVLRTYDGLGQVTAEYQAHAGAVDTSTTPVVRYAYSEMAGGGNNSRLTGMTYPNGRVVNYNYASGVNDAISRLSSISDSSATLESYKYLGLSTVVERDHPQDGVSLTYIGTATGDAGDKYTGLDRFGRVTNQKWVNASGTVVDGYTYTYDRDGNATGKANTLNSALSETYTYDGLNRLATDTRNGAAYQSWTLDAVGNTKGITTQGTTESRTTNSQNELTQVGTSTLAYDANGNMTTDANGDTLVYDAWNRLIAQENGATVQVNYAYDGLNRRIKESSNDVYFNTNWQEVEDRDAAGQTNALYTWSPVYVDAMIERDRDTDGDGTTDERLFVTQDANWNATAAITTAGSIAERFSYDSYGKRSVLNSLWSTTSNILLFQQGYQGGKVSDVTGRVEFRNRDYDVNLTRWIEADTAGYIDGANRYLSREDNPYSNTDSMGLCIDKNKLLSMADKYRQLQNEQGNLEKWISDHQAVIDSNGGWFGDRGDVEDAQARLAINQQQLHDNLAQQAELKQQYSDSGFDGVSVSLPSNPEVGSGGGTGIDGVANAIDQSIRSQTYNGGAPSDIGFIPVAAAVMSGGLSLAADATASLAGGATTAATIEETVAETGSVDEQMFFHGTDDLSAQDIARNGLDQNSYLLKDPVNPGGFYVTTDPSLAASYAEARQAAAGLSGPGTVLQAPDSAIGNLLLGNNTPTEAFIPFNQFNLVGPGVFQPIAP